MQLMGRKRLKAVSKLRAGGQGGSRRAHRTGAAIVAMLSLMIASGILAAGASAAETPAQLGAMAITEPFNGTTSPISNFATTWSKLGWDTNKGSVGSLGWTSSSGSQTSGAYYAPSISDPGTGVADVVNMAINPGFKHSFSLWLDLQTPGGAKSGYEFRLLEPKDTTYTASISKWVAGTETVLKSETVPFYVKGTSFAFSDQEGKLTAWVNGGSGFGELIGASDSTYTTGNVGIEANGGSSTLSNFRTGDLLPSVANTNAAVEAIGLRDPFTTKELPLSFGGAFAALSWDNGTTRETGIVEGGWRPWDSGGTIDGAYWQKNSFADTGAGDGVSAKIVKVPSLEENKYLALWLNMPNPATAHSGYELKITKLASGIQLSLIRWQAGAQTVLASKTNYPLAAGNSVALVDSLGTVSVRTKTGTEFTQVLSAGDATYTSGYAGVEGNSPNAGLMQEFKAGPLPPIS
jgi:hypothetical protein